MIDLGLALVVGVPLVWHLGFAAYAYVNAPSHGLSARKWGLIVLLVPVLGLFAYLFERSEVYYEPEDDPYREGGINVHEDADVRPEAGRDRPEEWDEEWDEQRE